MEERRGVLKMSYCDKECWYKDGDSGICGIPLGLKSFRHCECGQCIKKERAKELLEAN